MKKLLLVLVLLSCTACQQMGTSEYGVVFRKLPPAIGGGVSRKVLEPGSTVLIWPWESVYRFDTSIRSIEWGAGNGAETADTYVHTRARDGNEVALAVKVQYRISGEPERLVRLVQEVAQDDEDVARIVAAVGRADIRTYMGELNTAEFFRNEKKYEGEQQVREGMQKRLAPFGIEIQHVNLKEHRFERVLPDGSIDGVYQERINQVQAINEQTKREELRKETVLAEKKREFNETQGEYDRIVAEATGYRDQATSRGQAYFESKSNEAMAIRATGEAEVKGMVEQINALAGPGGAAILKLEMARQLMKSNPRFVVMSPQKGSGNAISVNRFDANQMMEQIGLMEGLAPTASSEQAKEDDKKK